MLVQNSKVGILPGSFKPFHLGHYKMIQKASNECDRVIVIVSLLDRDEVLGSDMAKIWKTHILKIMPENVNVIFMESSPISRVFQILKLREANPMSEYLFQIYSDQNDINKNFNDNTLNAVCPNLLKNNEIKRIGVNRKELAPISATMMRKYIRNGDFSSFSKNMPEELDSQAIFDILAQV